MSEHVSGRVRLPGKRGLLAALAAMLAAALAAAACGSDEPDQVRFMTGFKPQANLPFAAAFVAEKQGYFADEGLQVEILHSQGGQHIPLLASGEIDITTADAGDVLQRNADGVPITAVTLFGQEGQQAFIALESSGIATPKDWEGKRFGYKGTVPPAYLAILQAAGVDRSAIEEIRVGFDPRVLSEGQVDVLAVFKANEPNVLANLGFPVTIFDPVDFGVPQLGLTYVVNDDTLEEKSDVIERFVAATLRAVEFAMENEEATLDIILEFAPLEDREHQRFMLRQELAKRGERRHRRSTALGSMTEAQWQALYDHLTAFDALSAPFDVEDAFDARFVEAAHDN